MKILNYLQKINDLELKNEFRISGGQEESNFLSLELTEITPPQGHVVILNVRTNLIKHNY